MGIKLQSGDGSTNLANVNSDYNLAVVSTQDLAGLSAGFAQMSAEVDAGDATGNRSVVAFECSDDYRLRTGVDQVIFNSTFEGTNILTTQWNTNASITNTVISNGFINLNGAVITSASAFSYFRTWRHFPVFGTYPTYLDLWIREGNYDATNAISEWGFLFVTSPGTQQPLDGIFFRRTSGGELKAIVTTGIGSATGFDSAEIPIDTSRVPSRSDKKRLYDPGETNHYIISTHNDIARFWINDVLVAEIKCPPQLATMQGSSNLPVGLRMLNLATAASAPRQVGVGYVSVATGDQNTNKPWSHAMSGIGGGAYQLQIGNVAGPTVTRTAATTGHPASSTARTAGTWLANSSPALNNLGGLWTSPAISTLSSDADYPVFSFLNPVGTAAIPGKTLYITGVRIGEAFVSVAASTSAFFLSYIVMVEGSAAAPNTTDSATTVSNKSITIGGHGFGADGIGVMKEGFDMTFSSPLVIPAGRYIQLIVRPFGTVAGNSAVLRGSVSFTGYFE